MAGFYFMSEQQVGQKGRVFIFQSYFFSFFKKIFKAEIVL